MTQKQQWKIFDIPNITTFNNIETNFEKAVTATNEYIENTKNEELKLGTLHKDIFEYNEDINLLKTNIFEHDSVNDYNSRSYKDNLHKLLIDSYSSRLIFNANASIKIIKKSKALLPFSYYKRECNFDNIQTYNFDTGHSQHAAFKTFTFELMNIDFCNMSSSSIDKFVSIIKNGNTTSSHEFSTSNNKLYFNLKVWGHGLISARVYGKITFIKFSDSNFVLD